jgi:multiple sugar transport system permease protein
MSSLSGARPLPASRPAVEAAAPRRMPRWLIVAGTYVVLTVIAYTTLIPFIWMVSSSLKAPSDIFAFPPRWMPSEIVWENYVEAWNAIPFARMTFNSLYVAVVSVVGQIFICSLAGYGFARFEFPFKRAMFGMLLAVIMVPSVVNIIPLYVMYRRIGWLDTHLPLIVPMVFASTFGTFLFRQFMMSIPQDLEDAARLDGAGPFRIYWSIMLPLCKAPAAVLATITFIASWNNFFEPLIFLSSIEMMTVPVGLAYFRTEVGVKWHLLMAASTISIIPTIIVFLATQRYYVQGLARTGIKF